MNARGSEVSVAYANDRVEAGMIRGLLDGAGIPSAEQPVGIDGPTVGVGLLNPGGGARRILVHSEQADAARALLAEAFAQGDAGELDAFDAGDAGPTSGGRARNHNLIGAYARAMLWSLVAMGLAFAIFVLLRQI